MRKRITPVTFRLTTRGIPGRFVIARGTVRDYRQLAHFHYCRGAPATWAGIWMIRYFPRERSVHWAHLRPHSAAFSGATEGPRFSGSRKFTRTFGRAAKWVTRGTIARAGGSIDRARDRLVAVAVLSYPVPSSLGRRAALGITGSRADELRFANRQVRTISRVIVHPQFRSLGLATRLVRCICAQCDTRYVEAMAVMGRAHPLFERGGMRRVDPPRAPKDSRRKPGQARPGAIVYYLFDRQHAFRGGRARDGPRSGLAI
jgi:GNAT superfamily N-acetyltransferase